MSGECDECGEHCLQCTCGGNRMNSQIFGWVEVDDKTVVNLSVVTHFEKLDTPTEDHKMKYSICFNIPGDCAYKFFDRKSERDDFYNGLKEHLDVLA